MLRILAQLFVTVWLGFVSAMAIQVHRQPDWSAVQGVDVAAKTPMPSITERMEQALFRRNAEMQITEAEMNRYLAGAIGGRQPVAEPAGILFERVALDFEPNQARLLLSWTGPKGIHSRAALNFTVMRREGHFIIEPRYGSLGRMPIPRGLMCTFIPSLTSLCRAMEVEIHNVFQMNRIRFEKDRLVLDPRSDAPVK